MTTSYSVPVDAFLTRIEADREFFSYLSLSEAEAMSLAIMRSETYLGEAVGLLTLKCTPDIDFYDQDKTLKLFNFALTGPEIFLLSSLMYEMYMSRDIAKLKCLSANYSPSDLRVFDPSNARSTFKSLYETVCAQNLQLIDDYVSKDRESGKPKGIKYSNYDETE